VVGVAPETFSGELGGGFLQHPQPQEGLLCAVKPGKLGRGEDLSGQLQIDVPVRLLGIDVSLEGKKFGFACILSLMKINVNKKGWPKSYLTSNDASEILWPTFLLILSHNKNCVNKCTLLTPFDQ